MTHRVNFYNELLWGLELEILGNMETFVREYVDDIDHIYTTFESSPCPYHNFRHLMGCALLVDYMCDYLPNINPADRDSSIKAAMYHDYMYKGDRDDHINVVNSVEAAGDRISLRVGQLIMHTQFPYIDEPHDPMVDIIRDVDILYGTVFHSTDLVNRLYLALGHKLKIYNIHDFIDRNIEFIRDHEYRTCMAKSLHKLHIDAAINSHYDILHEFTPC